MLREIPHLKVIDRPVNRGKGIYCQRRDAQGGRSAYVSSLMPTIPLISRIFEKMKPFSTRLFRNRFAIRRSREAVPRPGISMDRTGW